MILGNTPAVIAADNVPTVGIIKPVRKTVSAKLAIPANVVPYEQAEIYAKASGYVKKVLVDIGDRVNPGQILAELDLPEMAMEMKVVEAELRKAQAMFLEASQADKLKAQANLEKLQTALNLQNIHFRRVEQLFKDKAYTEAQFEEAEGNLETAKANLLLAKAELEATEQGEAVAKANVELNQAKVDRMKTLIDYETLHAP
ncbi:MAG: biotin/lipoyl-binding protein, partial [Opitutales bacterium]